MFGEGDLLPPELIGEIQQTIDDCFVTTMMKDDIPIDKFGSSTENYTQAIDKYKVDVLNALGAWQSTYEQTHGKLNVNLQGRAAYALRYTPDGKAPRPLLTLSYITVLDTLLERIPSTITEVSVFNLHQRVYVLHIWATSVCCPPCIVWWQVRMTLTNPALPHTAQGGHTQCICIHMHSICRWV